MTQGQTARPVAVIVMGVSGCGKSSVGAALADRLAADFLEGDSLHPQANVDKMAQSIPLTDADRWPWLEDIGRRLQAALEEGRSLVVSCSALKQSYRDLLRSATGGRTLFVFLEGSRDVLARRMGARQGHFMPLSLLDSQLATLESPRDEAGVVTVDIDQTLDSIVSAAQTGVETLA